MTKWRGKARYGMRIIVILLLLLIGGTYVSNRMTEHYIISQQKAMIGRLYEINPEVCEEWLGTMFEEVSDAELALGNEALLEYGYTQAGMDYWFAQSQLKQMNDLVILVQMVLVVGMIYCIWRLYRAQEKCITQQLEEEMFTVSVWSEKEIKIAKDMAQKFVEDIAHQIKTPLACISISLDMLLETLHEDCEREKVREAFCYLKQIEVLMKRLLDIGRLEAGKLMLKKEMVSLEEILHSCARSLDAQGTRIEIETVNETEDAPVFYGDYDWLREAFSNIFKNALEHDTSNAPVIVRLRYQKELIFVQIRDFGSGIALEDIKYIFDRFYIPDNAKKGHTGIGLNLAKLVIEKHFGTIEAVNHEEGGVAFTICFPIYGLKNERM